MEIPNYIKNFAKFSPEEEARIGKTFKKEELSKGTILFRQGDLCRKVFYIEKGLARVFYYSNTGKDITIWFLPETSFVTAIDSFYQFKPTYDNCELLEDSVVFTINYSEVEKMLNESSVLSKLAFQFVFGIAKQMSEYIVSIKFQTAEERYQSLLNNYPSIIQRVSLGHIASYLGITQETLSRIRGKS